MINKTKFWWVFSGFIIIALLGLNLYLLLLRKSIVRFIAEEAELGNLRVEKMRNLRGFSGNPQDAN